MVSGALSAPRQVGKMLLIQLVLDAVLHDVLNHGRPAGHLISLLGDSLFARHCVLFLAVAALQTTQLFIMCLFFMIKIVKVSHTKSVLFIL